MSKSKALCESDIIAVQFKIFFFYLLICTLDCCESHFGLIKWIEQLISIQFQSLVAPQKPIFVCKIVKDFFSHDDDHGGGVGKVVKERKISQAVKCDQVNVNARYLKISSSFLCSTYSPICARSTWPITLYRLTQLYLAKSVTLCKMRLPNPRLVEEMKKIHI